MPDPLPEGEHGTLMRYQQVEPGLAVDGATPTGSCTCPSRVAGDPIAVTGTAVVPTARGAGRRPAGLTLAHGTTGIADECAPSQEPRAASWRSPRPVPGAGLPSWPTPTTRAWARRAATRTWWARARAAACSTPRSPPASCPTPRPATSSAIFGYSQGGHGALWAGQLAEEWAPDLDLVGHGRRGPGDRAAGIIFGAGGPLPVGRVPAT